jgi:hypothetical protein
MLHIFSINLVKVVTRKPKTTYNKGRMEYIINIFSCIFKFEGNSFPLHIIVYAYVENSMLFWYLY